jgi:hypothetical protein
MVGWRYVPPVAAEGRAMVFRAETTKVIAFAKDPRGQTTYRL